MRKALEVMVIDKMWTFWRKIDINTSRKIKELVVDDSWWERIDFTLLIVEPIITLLHFADLDVAVLGEVYEAWDSLIEKIKHIHLLATPFLIDGRKIVHHFIA